MRAARMLGRRPGTAAVTWGASLALVLGGGTAALASSHAQASNVCPPPDGGSAAFSDVAEGGTFEEVIECAANYGIVDGFGDGTYRPGVDVSRGAMAKFIFLLVESAGPGLLNPDAPNTFSDVPDGGTFEEAISALAEAAIVDGTGDGTTYEPAAPVRRGEMAKFIANAIGFVTNASLVDSENPDDASNGADDTAEFSDVDASGVFGPFINALAAEDVVIGSDGLYQPGGLVSRAQMAAFVMRSAAYLDSVGLWLATGGDDTPPDNQTVTEYPELVSAAVTATDAGASTIEYTFDEPVNTADATTFHVYTGDRTEYTADTAAVSVDDASVVVAQFGAVDATVAGMLTVATVEFVAVLDADGNFSLGTDAPLGTGAGAGRTDAPDLVGVTSAERTDGSGTVVGHDVTYTFDEDVTGPDATLFSAWGSGTEQYSATSCTVGATEDTDAQVTCAFGMDAAGAVLGTVFHGAVTEQDGSLTNVIGGDVIG